MTVHAGARVLLAYLHAAASLSAYILLKEITYWTPLLDSLVAVVAAIAIVVASLVVPRFVRLPAAPATGLTAGLATLLISAAAWALIWSDWAGDKPWGYAPFVAISTFLVIALVALWLLAMACMIVAIAIGTGCAHIADAALRRFGLAGATFAAAAAVVVSIVPAALVRTSHRRVRGHRPCHAVRGAPAVSGEGDCGHHRTW